MKPTQHAVANVVPHMLLGLVCVVLRSLVCGNIGRSHLRDGVVHRESHGLPSRFLVLAGASLQQSGITTLTYVESRTHHADHRQKPPRFCTTASALHVLGLHARIVSARWPRRGTTATQLLTTGSKTGWGLSFVPCDLTLRWACAPPLPHEHVTACAYLVVQSLLACCQHMCG